MNLCQMFAEWMPKCIWLKEEKTIAKQMLYIHLAFVDLLLQETLL